MARIFKWILIGSFVTMLLLFALVFALALAGPMVPRDSILLVTLDQELRESPEGDLFSSLSGDSELTLRDTTDSIRRAATDKRIVGLVLQIKSPALGMAQLQEFEEAMAVFRATDKWNVAHLETAGEFSGGTGLYALAVTADELFLSPPGDVNLVGLAATTPFLKGTLERLKIGVHVDKRHEFKNAPNSFTHSAFTPPHKKALAEVIDDLQLTLIQQIATRRNVEPAKARRWIETGPHLGAAALAEGLVDELRYWDEVVAAATKVAGRDEAFINLEEFAATGELHDSGPTVALIYGDGQVTRGEGSGGSSPVMGSDTVMEAFQSAREEKVKGVLFRVDSPGGSYVASDLIRREVQVTREAGIPVVVSMGNVAASGGYFVAMEADKIVAQPSTITGSIGVFVGAFAFRDFWRHWLGMTFDTYTTTASAEFFSALDLPNAEKKARIGSFLDRVYDDFVTKAAAGRGQSKEEMDAKARGRIWSGRAAKERGLVDELGGMERALELLKEAMQMPADETVTLELFPKPKTTFELLSDQFSTMARVASLMRGAVRLQQQLRTGGQTQPLLLPVDISAW